jgi:hypothetical protein
MKRIIFLLAMTLVMAVMMVLGGSASASIYPLVESFDCASEQPFEHHPLGDPAQVPGQTRGYGATLIRARCARSKRRTNQRSQRTSSTASAARSGTNLDNMCA